MPATTRSANRQPKLEDLKGVEISSPQKPKSKTSSKRKAPTNLGDSAPASKKQKSSSSPSKVAGTNAAERNDESITINRAPVLELWATTLAHFLYPSLPYSTCLSIGSAIATITAISKGRAIGKIDKPDPDEAAEKKKARQEAEQGDGEKEADVMGFNLKIQDGVASVGGKKGKKGSEEGLKRKFGEGELEMVRGWFEAALEGWKGREEEINKKGFKMYEGFRPTVPKGEKGWGRKGVVSREEVESVVGSG